MMSREFFAYTHTQRLVYRARGGFGFDRSEPRESGRVVFKSGCRYTKRSTLDAVTLHTAWRIKEIAVYSIAVYKSCTYATVDARDRGQDPREATYGFIQASCAYSVIDSLRGVCSVKIFARHVEACRACWATSAKCRFIADVTSTVYVLHVQRRVTATL